MDLYQKLLKRYDDVSDHVGELIPADVLPAEMRLRDVGFIVIGPAKPLASINLPILRFLTGTLNLSFATRRRWLTWGFHETFRRMRRVGMADPKGIVFIPRETREPL
jgi:hypothetical protein